DIDETVRSLLVEPDHPVPQGLAIHATNLGGLLPRGAVEHGCNRSQPSRLCSIFRSLGKPANFAGGVVRPHRNSVAHGKPPQFAILNHAGIDSGIPRESATQRLGITGKITPAIRPKSPEIRGRSYGTDHLSRQNSAETAQPPQS